MTKEILPRAGGWETYGPLSDPQRNEQLATETRLVSVRHSPSSPFAGENTATLCLQCLVSEGPRFWLPSL